MSRVPQRQVVDTRKATNVNLDKYDEKLQDMADARSSGKRDQQAPQGKEKFRSNKQRRDNNFASNKRKQEEADRLRKLRLEVIKKTPVTVQIPDEISVGELASRMKKTGAEVVKCLMKNGVMASLSQMIDFDTAAIIAEEMGCKVEKEVVVTIEERLIDDHQDKDEDLVPRAPVVVVMGHVDHGKTSLLDYIRNAHVASGEAGGITQHIGAYQVQINGKPITFLDTPGHEAFTSMRARGAMVTDIAILVVAAEDGIMPQTVESINHAKAAGIPIIVAINKMDKPEANPERIKQQLTEYGLVCEEWGGDTIVCPISAKTGMGVDNLLEMLTLTAEVGELKANPNRAAQGTVIEARLDKGRGPVATLLVQNGTLHQGDIIIAGTSVGRVRAMVSDKGQRITEAGPSVPVEITGLSEAPSAGATFNAVADEKLARELVEQRKAEEKAKANAPVTKVSLEDLFSQIQAGEMKNLNLIVKADVQGSVEAVKSSLEKLSNEEVRVRVIHGGVGAINESDVMLASTSQAIIVGFNVRPDAAARTRHLRPVALPLAGRARRRAAEGAADAAPPARQGRHLERKRLRIRRRRAAGGNRQGIRSRKHRTVRPAAAETQPERSRSRADETRLPVRSRGAGPAAGRARGSRRAAGLHQNRKRILGGPVEIAIFAAYRNAPGGVRRAVRLQES